jgi:hypothetical protein
VQDSGRMTIVEMNRNSGECRGRSWCDKEDNAVEIGDKEALQSLKNIRVVFVENRGQML